MSQKTNIEQIMQNQRVTFASGLSQNVTARLKSLVRLRQAVRRHSDDILDALYADLGRAKSESYMAEVGLVLEELNCAIRNLRRWTRDHWAPTPLVHFPSRSFIRHEPYGVVLIMSPWNYPFLLALAPLVGAVAAGNCAVLKPSAYAPATSRLLRQLLHGCFARGQIDVVEGGRAENTELLNQRFDMIFFTGSVAVGKQVMAKASQNLTPVVLELGGKSPCIVDASANLATAARRIAFGKFLNAGQTCVAPDYLLVHASVRDALIAELRLAVRAFFGSDPLQSAELPKIINDKHFTRLKGLMKNERVALGGRDDGKSRIEPTVLCDVSPDAPVMQEEIFGPILPVLTFNALDEAIRFVNHREKPLALYVFSTDPAAARRVTRQCSFGGGCINDTIVHMATTHMGFGGVGQSGMGNYHGKRTFLAFSHEKSLLQKANWPDLDVRYHPYTEAKNHLIRLLMH